MKVLVSYLLIILSFIFLSEVLQAQQEIEATLAGATTNDGFLVQDNSDNSLFRVRGDGNVSIGTASPSITSGTGLHIYGSNDATIKVEGNSTGNNNAYFNGTPNDQGDMYVTNDGAGDLYLGVGARNARHLTIMPSGNVGIGITTPSATLQIDGTTKFGTHSNVVSITDVIEVTGTTNSTGVSTVISLPTGWDENNTRVISASVKDVWGITYFTGTYQQVNHNVAIFCCIQSAVLNIFFPGNGDFNSRPFKILLMKAN